jgi:hypothetical protein
MKDISLQEEEEEATVDFLVSVGDLGVAEFRREKSWLDRHIRECSVFVHIWQ